MHKQSVVSRIWKILSALGSIFPFRSIEVWHFPGGHGLPSLHVGLHGCVETQGGLGMIGNRDLYSFSFYFFFSRLGLFCFPSAGVQQVTLTPGGRYLSKPGEAKRKGTGR